MESPDSGGSIVSGPILDGMAYDDLVRLMETSHIVAIITRRSNGTPLATPIAVVVIDGVPYVRSAYGQDSWWYRHAISGRQVAFAMGSGSVAERDRDEALRLPAEVVRAEHVAAGDPALSLVSAAISKKYAGEAGATQMVSERAVAATLRILPADA
jgi:hypothetical protein